MEKDYYTVLGLDSKASKEEIEGSYRQLLVQNHPQYVGKEHEIHEAYKIVEDSLKRPSFDDPKGNRSHSKEIYYTMKPSDNQYWGEAQRLRQQLHREWGRAFKRAFWPMNYAILSIVFAASNLHPIIKVSGAFLMGIASVKKFKLCKKHFNSIISIKGKIKILNQKYQGHI